MPGFKQRVLGAVADRFLAQARVEAVETLSDQFRLITLSSEKFMDATMEPAAKVRLNAGDWNMRAYTPLSIDTTAGHVRILAYLHGGGPGSNWARAAAPGDLTRVLGPQPSLDLIKLSQAAVFFGDETSFAAAKTLQSHLAPGNAARFIFEVSNVAEAHTVIERLELLHAECFERKMNDMHLPRAAEAIQGALASMPTRHLVLTGNGRSIQAIRLALRTHYPGAIDYHVKAYWAPGKVGLE